MTTPASRLTEEDAKELLRLYDLSVRAARHWVSTSKDYGVTMRLVRSTANSAEKAESAFTTFVNKLTGKE